MILVLLSILFLIFLCLIQKKHDGEIGSWSSKVEWKLTLRVWREAERLSYDSEDGNGAKIGHGIFNLRRMRTTEFLGKRWYQVFRAGGQLNGI